MLTLLFFLLCILLSPGSTVAAPTVSGVSGTVGDGQSITITGSSFGSTGPTVVLFDNFESGTNGNVISTSSSTVGNWDGMAGSSTTYTTAFAHGGTKAARNNWGTSNAVQMELEFAGTTEIFFSFWNISPSGEVPGAGEASPNWKFWWLWDGDFTVGEAGSSDYTSVLLADDVGGTFLNFPFDDLSSGSRIGSNFSATDMDANEWTRWDNYLRGHTSTGQVQTHNMNAGRTYNQVTTETGYTLISGSLWSTLTIPGYGRIDPGVITGYDDIYVATGTSARARVEISNNATYTSSTNAAIATVTSWSATSVTATVRQGSFSDGAAYLYVFDSSGVPNTTGFPVTIGSGVTQHTVTITPAGTGTGTVTSSPAGISCGATCAADFDENEDITLTASPDGGSTFTGWSNGCTGTSTCVISNITSDQGRTATFTGSIPAAPGGLTVGSNMHGVRFP